jgi:hypothetical protein
MTHWWCSVRDSNWFPFSWRAAFSGLCLLLIFILRGGDRLQAAPVGAPAGLQPEPPAVYIVQPGDTLAELARRFHVRPIELLRANGPAPSADLAAYLKSPLPAGQTVTVPALTAHAGRRNYVEGQAPLVIATPFPAQLNHLGSPRFVLADYMMWYNPSIFDGTKTFDLPAAGPYDSSSPATIRRQLAEAQSACLDGFAAHWYGPFDPITTNNFQQLLTLSHGTPMQHAALLLTNTWPGTTEQTLIDAINYVLTNWADDPNYRKIDGRPLLIFTDMYRPFGEGNAGLAAWGRIRAATDPDHKTIWMAEGLYTTYNPLFDGLYVYRIDHRDYPQAYLKQARFANLLHALEQQQQGNLPVGGLYWADSIAPGYDDTRAGNTQMDFRDPSPPFARDRRAGGYYADTFAATAETNGDFLIVKSFNEWVEGTAIEPSQGEGDLYLNLTCQYANTYRQR